MGARLLAPDGEHDPMHLLIEYLPKLVSVLVNALKGTSSRRLRRDRADVAARHRQDVPWSPSYFLASAGATPLEKSKEYVEAQRGAEVP